MSSRITLIGTQRELMRHNKSIADTWELSNTSFDSETLLATIVNTSGQCGVLYSDPFYFYEMCGYFWNKYKDTFERWFDTLELDYNTLDNFSKSEILHENTVDTGTGSLSETKTGNKSSGSITSNTSGTITSDSGSDTTTNTVSAFDSSSYSPSNKSDVTSSNNGTSNTTENGNVNTTDNTSESITNSTTDNNTRNRNKTATIHGNTGSKSYQELIESELKLRSFSVYQHIADIFSNEMLICVY